MISKRVSGGCYKLLSKILTLLESPKQMNQMSRINKTGKIPRCAATPASSTPAVEHRTNNVLASQRKSKDRVQFAEGLSRIVYNTIVYKYYYL